MVNNGFKKSSMELRNAKKTYKIVAADSKEDFAEILINVQIPSSDLIIIIDPNGQIIKANSTIKDMLGYSLKAIEGVNINKILPYLLDDMSGKEGQDMIRPFDGERKETTARRKDGKEILVEFSTRRAEFNEYPLYVSSIRDITERKELETVPKQEYQTLQKLVKERTGELVESNGQLQREIAKRIEMTKKLKKSSQQVVNILESIDVSFFAFDNEWKVTYINKKADTFLLEHINKSRKELLGKKLWEVFPGYLGTITYKEYQGAKTKGKPVHFETLSPYNNKWYEVNAYPSDLGPTIFFRDITKKKSQERDVNHLAEIVNSSNDAIISCTLNGTIISWNPGAERIYDYQAQEIIGKNITVLIPYERQEELTSNLLIIDSGREIKNVETIGVSNRGKIIDLSVSIFPLKDVGDNITGFSCIYRDISDKKIFEKEIARLDRLNLIGQIAAGVAHEIRNPMSTVYGFLQLFLKNDNFQEYHHYFNLMMGELERVNSIIKEFLSMTQTKSLEKKNHNLNEILNSMYPLFQTDALKNYNSVKMELGKIPLVYLNEKEIRQMVINLVRNGLEAMEPRRHLLIRTFTVDKEVILEIVDEGPGISLDVLAKIGTPFFTTKENGTGLGFAVCQSIASRHNTSLDIKTGSFGTTVSIRFKTKKKRFQKEPSGSS